MIVSKRHPAKFYLGLSILGLFLCGIGALLLTVFISELFSGTLSDGGYSLPFFSIFFFLLFYSVLKAYLKNSPKIKLDKDFISFGNKTYRLSDINEIVLTGKKQFKLFINFPMEGASIKFKNGVTKIIFDDIYSNTWQIKSFLEKTLIEKAEYKIPDKQKRQLSPLKYDRIDEFKGNQFTSLRGISLWGLILFFIGIIVFGNKTNNTILLIFVIIGTIWFLINSLFMNYICLTKDLLVIKNHNFPWKEKVFELSEIKEVVFESPTAQAPNSIRILTKDYKNKLYPASTLRDKHWLNLKKQLEIKGIKVRNECIYEEKNVA